VVPLTVAVDDEPIATMTLSSPLSEIVTLGRLMLGEDSKKEDELDADDLDAISEILNLIQEGNA
jgi:chemotaxis protein CheY-P-specific phosphatase CheC